MAVIAFAPSFIAAIFGVVIVGAGKAFGENLALGYIARFDGRLVNAWSCGSGCAGLLGALFVIAVGCAIRLSTTITTDDFLAIKWYGFLSCSPIVLLYGIAYYVIIVESSESTLYSQSQHASGYTINASDPCYDGSTGPGSIQGDERASDDNSPIERRTLLNSDSGVGMVSVSLVDKIRMRWVFRWHSFKLVWKLGANLALANFASYVCIVAAAKAKDNTEYDQDCPELYASLQLCYMAAQFASLSSGQLFKIQRIEILMVLQLCNALVWGLDTGFKFMPVVMLPPYMVIVGLIMGAIYVNTFVIVHNDQTYRQEDRDLLANITSTFLTVGVSMCCILMTALYKTVLVDY